MLQAGFTSVLGCRTQDELQSEVVGFAKRLGFDTVAATVVIDHFLGDSEFKIRSPRPLGEREIKPPRRPQEAY